MFSLSSKMVKRSAKPERHNYKDRGTKESLSYHRSKFAGSFTSTAMRGKPTVRRPVLILLRKLMPVSAAITMILRP